MPGECRSPQLRFFDFRFGAMTDTRRGSCRPLALRADLGFFSAFFGRANELDAESRVAIFGLEVPFDGLSS